MMMKGRKEKRGKCPFCGFLLKLDDPAVLEHMIYCPDCEVLT